MADEPKHTPSAIDQIARMQAKDIERKGRNKAVLFSFGDEGQEEPALSLPAPTAAEYQPPSRLTTLEKSLKERLDENEFVRLAFEKNPTDVSYQVVYQHKPCLIPEWLLKRISHQDDLVASIVRTRANQLRTFGVPRPDRYSPGYTVELKTGVADSLTPEEKAALEVRIRRAVALLQTCGSTEGVDKKDQMNLGDFLDLTCQNAIVVGKVAVEKIHDQSGRFHSFRPVDAGTIFPATPQKTAGPSIRRQAVSLLARLQNKDEGELVQRLDLRRWANDEYAWVQVIESTPRMVFTDDQMIVRNFYPTVDVEMCGHPVTPLDTVISAVTTHMSLTTMTKVFFQSGRAAKGMLIIKSDDADQDTIKAMQAHFQANINSASNSYRLPVFAIGPNDEIDWQTIDQTGQRDMEFQYLGDAVARIIMSAFQMSPDELPGWSYLSKGTAAQTLSEGSVEYRIEAHRDLGIRPLIRHFEELIDSEILPLIDDEVARLCNFRLMGMDAKSAKDEANDLQIAQGLYLTMNDINQRVEKDPLPAFLGGDIPLNPQYHTLVLDKFVPVGVIMEHLMGIKGASKDPRYQFINNPLWLQFMQMQQAAQQPQPGQGGPAGQGGAPANASPKLASGQNQPQEELPPDPIQEKTDALKSEMGRAVAALGKAEDFEKSEAQMTPVQRRILGRHDALVKDFMGGFKEEAAQVAKDIMAEIDAAIPTEDE